MIGGLLADVGDGVDELRSCFGGARVAFEFVVPLFGLDCPGLLLFEDKFSAAK